MLFFDVIAGCGRICKSPKCPRSSSHPEHHNTREHDQRHGKRTANYFVH